MKKLIALLCTVSMLTTLGACGESETSSSDISESSVSTSSESETEETTAEPTTEEATTKATTVTTTTTTTTTTTITTESTTTTAELTTTIIETTTVEPVTEAPTEPKPETEDSYQSNEYYDIVETASYVNSIGNTILIHKVLAKQNVSVDSSIIAYSPEGRVIGKSSDDIILTEGEYNYFRYSFESDISNAGLQAKANAKETSSIGTGDRNAVEMVQYDRAEDDLFITFKQVSDNLGDFSKFKILFYKNDQIVDCEEGYFSVYAKNINGKDTTDVASIWVYGIDFDRIEYFFEP